MCQCSLWFAVSGPEQKRTERRSVWQRYHKHAHCHWRQSVTTITSWTLRNKWLIRLSHLTDVHAATVHFLIGSCTGHRRVISTAGRTRNAHNADHSLRRRGHTALTSPQFRWVQWIGAVSLLLLLKSVLRITGAKLSGCWKVGQIICTACIYFNS